MDGVDCQNIQHEGGVSKKNVEDTVDDTSRAKIFKFGEDLQVRRIWAKISKTGYNTICS